MASRTALHPPETNGHTESGDVLSPRAEPVLMVEDLSYAFPNGHVALDRVSFTALPGERVAIVGPSGAGKSTLLMHLNGLLPDGLDKHRGAVVSAVRLDGEPISGGRLAEVRRKVGFLFQDPDDQLFCPTVREDVAFGPLNLGLSRAEIEMRIAESLAAVDLAGFDERSTLHLSVGERKRVCLAGVLACRPKVLALDEPSSNLDPRARRTLLRILADFPGTQILATHDLDLVIEHCNQVVVLDGGRVRATGRPDLILADEFLMDRHGLEVPLRLRVSSGMKKGG